VQLDPLYLETVKIDKTHPMHVFIQMEGESQDVFVQPGTTSFLVKERNGGHSNAPFSYKVTAKRLNFQDHRFGNDAIWGAGDTRKFASYAAPPPIDYERNKAFQAEQRALEKSKAATQPVPEGYVRYEDLQKAAQATAAAAQREDKPKPTTEPPGAPPLDR
jgi:hypothetical protein